jgi:hypothetical protein
MQCVLLIKLYKVLMICMDTLIITVIVYGVQCFHISAVYCYGEKTSIGWFLVWFWVNRPVGARVCFQFCDVLAIIHKRN